MALNRDYNIRVTPALVVAGRYATNPGLVGSLSAMLAVVEQQVSFVRSID